MTDFEIQIARMLHESYAEVTPMNVKPWEALSQEKQKIMVTVVEKLIRDKVIEPGKYFCLIRGSDLGGGVFKGSD